MATPEVTFEPGSDRPFLVLHNDVVLRLKPLEATALCAKLRVRLKATEIVVPGPGHQMTDHQRRHLHALLREHGATGDGRFPILSEILERAITSTNQMSPADAARCIDVLKRTRPLRPVDDGEPF